MEYIAIFVPNTASKKHQDNHSNLQSHYLQGKSSEPEPDIHS